MSWYNDYSQFLDAFKNNGSTFDETVFIFDTDKAENEHYIGCVSRIDEPYWAGYCDIPDGCSFKTAEELLNAKIYNGKSIKERWNEIIFLQFNGIGIDEYDEFDQD